MKGTKNAAYQDNRSNLPGLFLAKYEIRYRSSFEKSVILFSSERNRINYPDYGHIDWGLGTAHGSHGAPALGDHQHAVAHTGVYRIQGQQNVTSVAAVEVQGLDNKNFAPLMAGSFLCCHHVTNYASNDHWFAEEL